MGPAASRTLPSRMDTILPRCVRDAFKQDNSLYGLLHHGVALYSRHILVNKQVIGYENANSLGKLWPLMVCRACGCGDNTIGHWTRWCPVPLIVALSILRPARQVDNLGQLAKMGVKYAVTCTLVIASFRRLLRHRRVVSYVRKLLSPRMYFGGSLQSMKWLPLTPTSN